MGRSGFDRSFISVLCRLFLLAARRSRAHMAPPGIQAFIIASGSMLPMAPACAPASATSSPSAAAPDRAGRKRSRASSGVQSISIFTFIWPLLSCKLWKPRKFTVESAPRRQLVCAGKDRHLPHGRKPTSMTRPRNRLGEETSPYLLQHKDNPVHWQAWGPEALAEAQARATSRSCSRSAMPPAIGAMSWPMRASRTRRRPR